jgi:hypothetical protein
MTAVAVKSGACLPTNTLIRSGSCIGVWDVSGCVGLNNRAAPFAVGNLAEIRASQSALRIILKAINK